MNDSTHVMRRPRRVWPRTARTAAATVATAVWPCCGGMQRQPIIDRFRRLTECGRVNELLWSRR